jgi:hypothetical protein
MICNYRAYRIEMLVAYSADVLDMHERGGASTYTRSQRGLRHHTLVDS